MRPEIKIPIPDVLKVKLVDDWEYITKNHQVNSILSIGEFSIYALFFLLVAGNSSENTECEGNTGGVQSIRGKQEG
jgi:hypothetical protein